MLNDIRHAFRQLWRAPALTLLAVLMLALGTGVNTAVFSVAHGLLLTPLPYPGGERLAQLAVRASDDPTRSSGLTPAQYRRLEAAPDAPWEAIASWRYNYSSLSGIDEPVRLTSIQATDTYFEVLGTAAWRGRTFLPEDAAPGASPRAVISHDLWLRELGAPARLDQATLQIDGEAVAIIGVMPPGWTDPFNNARLWLPTVATGGVNTVDSARFWTGMARLRPDVSPAQINAWLTTHQAPITADNPAMHADWVPTLSPLKPLLLGSYREGVMLLMGAAALVLLVTCANYSGLLLIRASARRHEQAVRMALGAERWPLLRTGLVESCLLAVMGGVAGIFAGWWGLDLLLATVPSGWLPRADAIELNVPVLAFALVSAALTGLAAGAYPAWSASSAKVQSALQSSGRMSDAPPVARLRAALVVGQIVLALGLLTSAGLVGRSLLAKQAINPGLQTAPLLRVGLSLSSRDFPDQDTRRRYFDQVVAAVQAVPGVADAAFTQTMPFLWGIPASFAIVGQPMDAARLPSAYYDSVGTDFLKTTRLPLQQGRWFAPTDGPDQPRVAVVSAATARAFFGDGNPLGQRLRFTSTPNTDGVEIIGVVADVPRDGLGVGQPLQVYSHLPQRPTEFATLLVRADIAPAALIDDVKRAIWKLNPDQAVANAEPVSELVASSLTESRLYSWLIIVFAALTLGLATIGLYATMTFSIHRRTREFGVRMAIGAEPRRILQQVLQEGLRLTLGGAVLGLVFSVLVTRLLETMLYATSPLHLPTYLAVTALVLLTALFAIWLPARRATRIAPAEALRSD
ncbi:ABC transporter permease [Synoicihabitans lomoniglobus]|uniref:ABC transporter permease n=1 Tax=Synoicihabitans lomoniglobus TaxID=2909285 RepID=A0AAF0CS28_9BACT|nr:ABC transporter permease [Opitutaceae bacterium LMO-M01]WED66951.1 ABC transporter permease [Opitutaceae bacterium LMO-M01]